MSITLKQMSSLMKIINSIKEKDKTISEISKDVDIKRSTLNYYLNLLERENFIVRERVLEKKTGRPTIVKFNKEKYEEKAKKLEEEFKREEEEMLNHPLTLKILNFLKTNPNPTSPELSMSLGNYYGLFSILSWLNSKGYVINRYGITEQGEKFLESHK